jgi:hypothetical protein
LNADMSRQRRACADLAAIPDGAVVALSVGARWPVLDLWCLDELRAHETRLTYVIEGSSDAIRDGVADLRGDVA